MRQIVLIEVPGQIERPRLKEELRDAVDVEAPIAGFSSDVAGCGIRIQRVVQPALLVRQLADHTQAPRQSESVPHRLGMTRDWDSLPLAPLGFPGCRISVLWP